MWVSNLLPIALTQNKNSQLILKPKMLHICFVNNSKGIFAF